MEKKQAVQSDKKVQGFMPEDWKYFTYHKQVQKHCNLDNKKVSWENNQKLRQYYS